MKKQRFICRDCGCKFVVEVLEEGEAEERRLPTSPIRCKDCGSNAIERD